MHGRRCERGLDSSCDFSASNAEYMCAKEVRCWLTKQQSMKVVAVCGQSDARSEAADRLVSRLENEGSVGVITRGEASGPRASERSRKADTCREYELTDDGWRGAGESMSLDGALSELAPHCSYAVVEGFENPDLPVVVVGDRSVSGGTLLASAPSGQALDVDEVCEKLDAVDQFETLESLVAAVKQAEDQDKAGAIATFTGRVREKEDEDDAATEYLEFERYDDIAAEKMAEIQTELEDRDGVYRVLLHHRTGVIEASEDIVFVVVLAGHRPEAFATVEDGIDRLKAEVPLFKKEVTVEGTFWAHQHDHEH